MSKGYLLIESRSRWLSVWHLIEIIFSKRLVFKQLFLNNVSKSCKLLRKPGLRCTRTYRIWSLCRPSLYLPIFWVGQVKIKRIRFLYFFLWLIDTISLAMIYLSLFFFHFDIVTVWGSSLSQLVAKKASRPTLTFCRVWPCLVNHFRTKCVK